jgi:hypothetical protein
VTCGAGAGFWRLPLAAAALVLLGGCAGTGEYFRSVPEAPPASELRLSELGWSEYWTGIVFNGQKIGFTRFAVHPAPDAPGRYDIDSEAAMRLRFLGADKRINLRSRDRVRADLTLESFRYEQVLDSSTLTVVGHIDADSLAFVAAAGDARDERRIELHGSVYPLSAAALRPALQGLAVGRAQRYTVFNSETQELAEVEQRVLGYESSTLFEGRAFKVSTRMLGVETTTWTAPDGRPLFELSLQGTLISALEDEAAAKRFLVEASLNKDEALLDFSLIRSPPIERPGELARLEIMLDGVPEDFAVPSAGGQTCSRPNGRLRCTIDRRAAFERAGDVRRYLRPTLAAPSTQGDVVRLARSIAAGTSDPRAKLERILAWIDANIAKEAIDAFTASDVLRERRAECQGHAYLFAALARALGLPARVVNGITYSEAHRGFLYHTWNEVWIEGEGWRPVDATFNQPLADATHLKLIEGEAGGELAPLVALVGRLRVDTLAGTARW